MNKLQKTSIVLAGLLAATNASAQETIRLTAVSGNAPQVTIVNAFANAFIPAVEEALAEAGNYTIDWNEAYSGQIARPRGELEAVGAGLGDVGILVAAYTPDRLPLHQIAFSTPFAATDISAVAEAMSYMQETFPAFREELARANQIPLRSSAMVDNYVLYSRAPITSVADMEGRTIAAVGGNLPWVQAAGAAAVTAEVSTAFNSLQTGVYDGILLWNQIVAAQRICDPAPFALDPRIGGSASALLSVNADVWEGLPEEVREAFATGAQAWHEMNMDLLISGAERGLEQCRQEFGTELTEFSDEERLAWAEAMPELGREWAARANTRGEPGDEMLDAWMGFLRDAGQTPIRDWDAR